MNLANGEINFICLYSYVDDFFYSNFKFGFNSNVGFESTNPIMTEKDRSFVKKKLQETWKLLKMFVEKEITIWNAFSSVI